MNTESEIPLNDIIIGRNKCARIIAVFGGRYLPIFERLENEIIQRQKEQELLYKALQVSSKYGTHIGTQNGTHKSFKSYKLTEKFNSIK